MVRRLKLVNQKGGTAFPDSSWDGTLGATIASFRPAALLDVGEMTLASLPPQPIERGMVDRLAGAYVGYECDLPLYRQGKMFRQKFGVELSRKSIGCWFDMPPSC